MTVIKMLYVLIMEIMYSHKTSTTQILIILYGLSSKESSILPIPEQQHHFNSKLIYSQFILFIINI
jgi:hypothetical protein